MRCTPEAQKSQLYKAISADPFEDFWALGSTCFGCGRTRELKYAIPKDEATRVVNQHNAGLETPEAQYEFQHWSEEVERRTQHDANAFAARFTERFPETRMVPYPCLVFRVPRESGVGLNAILPWLPFRPHQEDDEIPVQAQVFNAEVIVVWQENHDHFRKEESATYHEDALDLMAKLYFQKLGKPK